MGQFRWRFDSDERIYEAHELEVGWTVRMVSHEMRSLIGMEGRVMSLVSRSDGGTSVMISTGNSYGSRSQRWVRIF